MPRQFMNRGDRLVFSNGILVLSVLAALLVWAFDADLTRLIQLYVVGVFTAFTLSQAGMVRRWRRLREPGWKRSAAINGIGAAATGTVLVIVTLTKFTHGAWIVVAAMPVIVLILRSIHRHYEQVRGLSIRMEASNTMVVVITDLGPAVRDTVSWIRATRPERVIPLYVGKEPVVGLEAGWAELAPRLGDLQPLDVGKGGVVPALKRFLRSIPREENDFVTVVIPEEVTTGLTMYLLRRTQALRIKTGLLFEPGVVVSDVPLLPIEKEAVARGPAERPLELARNVCIVPISAVHDATIRALVYAKSLNPARLEAIFLAGEPEEADEVMREWREREVDVPLSLVEAPFRDYGPPFLEEIRRHTGRGDTVVTVVLPEFVVRKWRHFFLHNQRALFFKRLMLFEPWVVAVSVPFHLR
jgi:hypothetical protein